MTPLPAEAWLAIAGIAGAAILTMLYTLAANLRNELELHELKEQAERLRREFIRQFNTEPGEILVVDEAPPEE